MKWILLSLLLVGAYFGLSNEKEEIKKVLVQKVVDSKPSITKEYNLSGIDGFTKEKNSKKDIYIEGNKTIDTLIDTNITIRFHIENLPKNSILNWWLDDKRVVTTDRPTLRDSFSLGEHHITLNLYDMSGSPLSDANITVRAWKYLKVEHYYFDREEDRYKLFTTKFYNHRNELLLVFNQFHRQTFIYNEQGKVLEELYESLSYPKNSYAKNYEYENEKVIFKEKLNSEGEIIESHYYDENGEEIVDSINKSDNIIKKSSEVEKVIKFYNKDGNLSRIVLGKDTINLKYKNGRIVYRENIHPKGKRIKHTEYSADGKLLFDEYLELDLEGNLKMELIWNYHYNKKGKKIRAELEKKIQGEVIQHFISEWHYKDGLLISKETNALVGVCPCTANIIKEHTTYSYDKNGTKISDKYEYQREKDTEFQKLKESKDIRSYTNILE